MAAVPAPASLPRDLLRWIQSLDLSYSVKNAKRDFANGFLVAEIFSRYYEQDITMHSFSNAASLDNKRDNWGLLMKFFKKRGVQPGGADITQEEVNDIMQAKAGAINTFLAKVYSFVTGKKITAPTVRATEDSLPAFAKSTAAHAIRETMRDPGIEAISDITTKETKMREALVAHRVTLAEEKMKDPARYTVAKRGQKVVKGASRAVGQEESVGSIEIKQVAVKSVDSSVANLRAAKELQASRSTLSFAGGSTLPDFDGTGLVSVMETLNTSVKAAATEKGAEALDPSLGPALGLVDKIVSPASTFPHAIAADIIKSINKFAVTSAAGDACLASPKEFYNLLTLFQPILSSTPESSPAFVAAVEFLVTVGKYIAQKDASLTARLFRDFALPSLSPVILSRATKRHAAMRLLYAFAAPTATGHLQAIRTLQSALNDLSVFNHCLSILVFVEDAFNDDLLDLYLYYCLVGFNSTSPSLRAACVAMLSVIAVQNADVVVGAIDQVLKLRDDTWWEVKAQLLIVASTVLDLLDPSTDVEVTAAILDVVVQLLSPSGCPSVLRVGVAYTAKLLWKYGPQLSVPYVKALLRVPADARGRLLNASGPKDELPLTGLSGGKYRLPCAVTDWPSDVVLGALVSHVQGDALEHLEVEHYNVLSALIAPVGGGVTSASESAVTAAFDALQSHLFVGICDPDCSGPAVVVLSQFVDGPVGSRVFASSAVQGALVLLHRFAGGPPDPQCQANAAKLFSESSSKSPALRAAVSAVLTAFKAANAELLKGSPLHAVARSLGL